MSSNLSSEMNGDSNCESVEFENNSPGNSDISATSPNPNANEISKDEIPGAGDNTDPLCIVNKEEEHLYEVKNDSDSVKHPIKRKLKLLHLETQQNEINKKQKTDTSTDSSAQSSPNPDDASENDSSPEKPKNLNKIFDKEIKVAKEVDISELLQTEKEEAADDAENDNDDDFDITEKLKEMAEISVKAVSKSDLAKKTDQTPDNVSVEITKKDKKDLQDRKVTNLRKNIKDVIDDSQLDAATLAAQRQETERLARVQEQQRIIRDVQKQIALEKQSAKTQQKLLTFLQNHAIKTSQPSTSTESLLLRNQKGFEDGKIPLTPSVSIQSTSRSIDLKMLEELQKESLEETEEIEDMMITKKPIDDSLDLDIKDEDEKKAVVSVTIDDSSSDDDCIILSDEEEEEPEDDPHNSGLHVKDSYNVPDSEGRVVVNIGHPENESDIYVAPQIAKIIKPHQIGGVRFLFDNIIESIDRFNSSTGFGCILAHSMGLGKTLQLVCFCDIFLRHTSSKTVLVIMPINTLQNWLHEFNMWIPLPEDVDKSPLKNNGEVRPRNFKIHVLNDSHKTLNARAKVVLEWLKDGGVLMMGYEMYRLLSQKKMSKPKKKKKVAEFLIGGGEPEKTTSSADQDLFDKIHEALVKPGPDLVVCDEGHRIKNSHASISLALKQIKSKRRVVLTGYPLQNNLMEYWCMVDFVRPNYLGTKTEFSNMFERPIQNGQCVDSTPQDVKLMRYRAHVLHSLLVGFVQRRSHVVLQSCLPQKEEYVLLVRMTPFQRKLYDVFMNEVVRTKQVPNPLKAFSVCCKIWNHPDVLYNFLKKREKDLDLELEEAESNLNKNTGINGVTEPKPIAPGPKKRGRKKLEKNKVPAQMGKDSKPISAATVTKNSTSTLIKNEISNSSDSSNLTQMANLTVSGSTEIKKEEAVPGTSASYPQPSISAGFSNSKSSSYPNTNSSNPPMNGGSSNSYPYNNYQNSNYNYPYQSHESSQNYYGNNSSQQNYYNSNGNNYWQGQNQNQYYPPQNQNYQDNYWNNQNYWNNPYPPKTEAENDQKPVKIEPKEENSIPSTVLDMQDNSSLNALKIENPFNIAKLEDKKLDDDPLKDLKEKEKEEKELGLSIRSSRDDGIPYDWAVELVKDYVSDLLENSPKMEVFFCILEESVKMGDRILVFSQSLLTLNLMERFLQKNKIPNSENCWAKNTSYFRLDGSTPALDREKLINEFNSNPNVMLFLVSTRAGSLGINLVGANRVIVFDASWNPCHDTQAVCRVYRYGQKKPCFVYRLVMDNCLEKKIYDRQVNKQGMSDRVIDECNPDAHLSMKEVTSLCWDDGEDPEIQDFSEVKDKYIDSVLQTILEKYFKALTKEPFQHESLLVDRKEKKLSMYEKRLAKRGYELEKQAATKPTYSAYNPMPPAYRPYRGVDGSIINRPVASVRPMQAELGDGISSMRASNPRPNRWIPAEVWQRQGMTAQEMTLPLDVVIPTSSADKQNIVLKAGQKVMVLKSPKGIYMQLETGKIIAIRTSMKMGQQPGNPQNPVGLPEKPPTYTSMQESAQTNNMPANLRNQALMTKNPRFNYPGSSSSQPKIDDEVINISNDEDEDDDDENSVENGDKHLVKTEYPSTSKLPPAIIQSVERIDVPFTSTLPDSSTATVDEPLASIEAQIIKPSLSASNETTYKEKVFRPNLVGRKPKVPPNDLQTQPQKQPFNYQPLDQKGGFRNHVKSEQSLPATSQFPGNHNNFPNYRNNPYPPPSTATSGPSNYYGNNNRNYNYNHYPPASSSGNNSNYNSYNEFNQNNNQKRNQPAPPFQGHFVEKPTGVTEPSPPPTQNVSTTSTPSSTVTSDTNRFKPTEQNPNYYPSNPIPASNQYVPIDSSYQHEIYPNSNASYPQNSSESYLPNPPPDTAPTNSQTPNYNYSYPYQGSYSASSSVPPPSQNYSNYPAPSNQYSAESNSAPPSTVDSQQPPQQSYSAAAPTSVNNQQQQYSYQAPTYPNYPQNYGQTPTQQLPTTEVPATSTNSAPLPSFGQWNYNN